MSFLIRPMYKSDLEKVGRMRHALWPEESLSIRQTETEAIYTGSYPHVEALLVAERDGTINQEKSEGEVQLIGFIELNIRGYAQGSQAPAVPYVEGWYVEENYRGQGVGKALMFAAENWAESQGFSELGSDADIDNHHSIAAHKQLGFEETDRAVHFLKRL